MPLEMLNKQHEESSKELRRSLHQLSEQAQRVYLLSAKMKEGFR